MIDEKEFIKQNLLDQCNNLWFNYICYLRSWDKDKGLELIFNTLGGVLRKELELLGNSEYALFVQNLRFQDK